MNELMCTGCHKFIGVLYRPTYQRVWLTHNTMLLVTAWYSPLTSCSNDTAVVWVWMLWRIVGWRWRINVELIVQHVSTVCQTTIV